MSSPYTSNDFDPLITIALAGKIVLMAPDIVIEPHVQDGTLVQLNVPIKSELNFVAITTRAASHSPILDKIVSHAVAIGGGLRAELDLMRGGTFKSQSIKSRGA